MIADRVTDHAPHVDALSWDKAPGDPDCASWARFHDIKRSHFDPRRRPVYQYAIMGHLVGTCSTATAGSAEGGNDFMVLLGMKPDQVGTALEQAIALTHELGHNLTLDHSGASGEKPAYETPYQSVMSYQYLGGLTEWAGGVGGLVVVDYSHELLSLDESDLDESAGLGANPLEKLYFAKWTCPDASWCLNLEHPQALTEDGECVRKLGDPIGPVDWDCDDVIDTGTVQVQMDNLAPLDLVEGGDDWLQILTDADGNGKSDGFEFQCRTTHYADAVPPDPESIPEEPDLDELERKDLLHPTFMPQSDPMPSCLLNPVPNDGTGQIQLAISGNIQLDPADITTSTLRLSGATPTSTAILDINLDGLNDLLAEFAVADLFASPSADRLFVRALLDNGGDIQTVIAVTRVATAVDGDSDGVDDRCDLCPATAAPAPSPDGCP